MEKSSAVGLRNLQDTITNHLTGLKYLGEPTEQWSTLSVFLVTRKLDPETRDRCETYQAKHNLNDDEDKVGKSASRHSNS